MIPPARQASENLSRGVPVPPNVLRGAHDCLDVGSYGMSESVMSEEMESPRRVGIDGEFSEDSANWMRNPRDNGKSPVVDNGSGFIILCYVFIKIAFMFIAFDIE